MATSSPNYSIKTIVFKSGERFPLLVDQKSGLPVYYPTAFALQAIRARGQASATIKQALHSISILDRYLNDHGIDLSRRFSEGRVLTLGEIEALAAKCQLQSKSVSTAIPGTSPTILPASRTLQKSPTQPNTVQNATTAIRLLYIANFIHWYATTFLQKLRFDNPIRAALETAIPRTVSAIKERIPNERKGRLVQREELDESVLQRVQSVIAIGSSENPWPSSFCQIRNKLIIDWLECLPLRRGELAGVRIAHLNKPMTRVQIVRRADDVNDPRINQPNAKTRERELELSDKLARDTREYVLTVRKQFPGAKTHDFLFVSYRTGEPLSLVSINRIFEDIRKVPGLPGNLSPHWYRHTWNGRFSALIDDRNLQGERISETTEHELRCYVNGWSPTSKTPREYNKRHIRRKAQKLTLELQRDIEDGK